MTVRHEVNLGGIARSPPTGQWSGIDHAFSRLKGAQDALRKFALLDQGNGADILSKIFRKSNFGYGRDNTKQKGLDTESVQRWGPKTTGGMDSFGANPASMSGPV